MKRGCGIASTRVRTFFLGTSILVERRDDYPRCGHKSPRVIMSGKSFGALLAEAYARPSNVDWCESNYAYSPLIAEMWNTASSVPMTFVAIFGLWKARECLLMESRWAWAWAMLAVVGVGSALFHATLLHVFQAADELPMLYCNLVFAYLMLEERAETRSRRFAEVFAKRPEHAAAAQTLRASRRAWLVPSLFFVGASQTYLYFAFPSVYEVFMGSYVTVILWLVARSVRLAWFAEDATKTQRRFVRAALACYGGGSAVWIFENVVCGVKGEEGGGWPMQWAHLHAVWHAGACLGTYHFIQFCSARRQGALGFDVRAKGGATWRSPLPYVARVAADNRDKRE